MRTLSVTRCATWKKLARYMQPHAMLCTERHFNLYSKLYYTMISFLPSQWQGVPREARMPHAATHDALHKAPAAAAAVRRRSPPPMTSSIWMECAPRPPRVQRTLPAAVDRWTSPRSVLAPLATARCCPDGVRVWYISAAMVERIISLRKETMGRNERGGGSR